MGVGWTIKSYEYIDGYQGELFRIRLKKKKHFSNYCTRPFKLENDQNQRVDFCAKKNRVKNRGSESNFNFSKLPGWLRSSLILCHLIFLEVQLPLMADVLHTKTTTQSWFLPSPKNNAEARQLFWAQQLFVAYVLRVGNNNFLAKNWGPHATESYFFLCISGFDAIICYLNLWGHWNVRGMMQYKHIICWYFAKMWKHEPILSCFRVLRCRDWMPCVKGVSHQSGTVPSVLWHSRDYLRWAMKSKGPWVFRGFVGDEIRPMLCGDYSQKPLQGSRN